MMPLQRRATRRPATGDVVVTTVAHHYNIGRVQADGDAITAITVDNCRADALTHASDAATGLQRVLPVTTLTRAWREITYDHDRHRRAGLQN